MHILEELLDDLQVTVTQEDAAGNVSPSSGVSLIKDTTLPSTLVINPVGTIHTHSPLGMCK